ncbi:MAG: hypothetical protein ACRDO2_12100, partial [Nocardioidaceae bacterium]
STHSSALSTLLLAQLLPGLGGDRRPKPLAGGDQRVSTNERPAETDRLTGMVDQVTSLAEEARDQLGYQPTWERGE